MLENIGQLSEVLVLIAIAVIAAYFGINSIIKSSKSSQAESSIITIMHSELERMSDQNTRLSQELGRLHQEVILLNQELQKLTIENQRLQVEVVALTQEVSRFKELAAQSKGRRYAAAS